MLERMDLAVLMELRGVPAPGETAEDDVAHGVGVGATYGIYASGTGLLGAAMILSLWIPAQAAGETALHPWLAGVPVRVPAELVLTPAIRGILRLGTWFGLWATLSLPITLVESPTQVLTLTVRPQFQPLPWLWFAAGGGVALAGSDDLRAPLEFELGFTPWRPLDLFGRLEFDDLVDGGVDRRTLFVGLRFRPQDVIPPAPEAPAGPSGTE